MGFTDWDWGGRESSRRRPRRAAPPAPGASLTAGPVAPVTPAMGDLWWDPAAKEMFTWNGMDWLLVVTGGPTAPLPPSFPRPDPTMPVGSMVLVVDGHLSDRDGRMPDAVRAYRNRMEDTAEHWAARHGFTVARGSWASAPPVDPMVSVPFRLECYLVPITDGIWGELRDAFEIDREDRQEAAGRTVDPDPADGPIVLHVAPEPA